MSDINQAVVAANLITLGTRAQLKLSAGGPGSGRKPVARFNDTAKDVEHLHNQLVSKGYQYKRTDSASQGRAVNHKYVHPKSGKSVSIYEHSGGLASIHK